MDSAGAIRKKEKEKLVIITWKDILQTSDWTPADEVTCPSFKSVGWLISDTNEEIKIGGTLVVKSEDPQDTPYGITAFPKGCVLSVDFIGE